MLNIEKSALDSLAALLLERAGLKIASDGYHGLKLALTARMPALGISDANDYVRRLRQLAGEHELRSLLPLVTVGHTEFFRDPRQFRALETRILPELIRQVRREQRPLGIWSAGCATGEEPYSLAMALEELGATPELVKLWATDVNPAAIETAKLGRFPLRRMASITPERLRRFFTLTDDGYEVQAHLKAFVHFEGQNLAAPIFPRVAPGSLDLILCRNVIIYFDLPTIRGLMDRFLNGLRPGGLLLLGYSESLFQVYDRFEMVEIEGSFVYRKPLSDGPLVSPRTIRQLGATGLAPLAPPAVAVRTPVTPLPSVRPASPPLKPRPVEPVKLPPPRTPHRSPRERLDDVVARITAGEFEVALERARTLSKDEPTDLDAMLTLGNIYSLIGRNAEAREVFAQVMNREPLCVEARLFGAVAELQAGNLQQARSELTKAVFLEPTLALPHYLLAQVQERLADVDGARRSYRNAIGQLKFPQRPLAGHYPELPEAPEAMGRAARYALAALEEAH